MISLKEFEKYYYFNTNLEEFFNLFNLLLLLVNDLFLYRKINVEYYKDRENLKYY
jgi:hypothetical protein